jgi:hypothetical protein
MTRIAIIAGVTGQGRFLPRRTSVKDKIMKRRSLSFATRRIEHLRYGFDVHALGLQVHYGESGRLKAIVADQAPDMALGNARERGSGDNGARLCRSACGLIEIARRSFGHVPALDRDRELRERLKNVARRAPALALSDALSSDPTGKLARKPQDDRAADR